MSENYPDLSVREYRILRLLYEGSSTKDVAYLMKLEVSTVNGYVRDLYQRLGLTDRLQLGIWIATRLHARPEPIQ